MLKPLIIGIAGGSGSGKSTVAKNVADLLTTASVAFIDMDAYYKNFPKLALDERKRLNWDHPDAFDYDLLCEHLKARAIGWGIYYPIPLHLQPVNRGLGYTPGSLPETERAAREVLSLPISPELTEETQRTVVKALKASLVAARTQVAVVSAIG